MLRIESFSENAKRSRRWGRGGDGGGAEGVLVARL